MSETNPNGPRAYRDDGTVFDPMITLTADIVSSFVSHNAVSARDLPGLIGDVHTALAAAVGLATLARETFVEAEIDKPSPAQIRKSITPDGIISFLDGKPYKTMRRHLATHGLTPETYRQRYGLPSDYPIVAASYSAARSALAKATGLGTGASPVEPAGESIAA